MYDISGEYNTCVLLYFQICALKTSCLGEQIHSHWNANNNRHIIILLPI